MDGVIRVSYAEIARPIAILEMSESVLIENDTEVSPDRKSLMLKSLHDGSCAYLAADTLCRINPPIQASVGYFRSGGRTWIMPRLALVYDCKSVILLTESDAAAISKKMGE